MIEYRDGYKYQLAADYEIRTGIFPVGVINDDFLSMDRDGLLRIKNGYAWDGPSGPTLDTKSFMRGSLVHDALYQLMRSGKLSHGNREAADKLLKQLCIEDGMGSVRAYIVECGVRTFGEKYAAAAERVIITAP